MQLSHRQPDGATEVILWELQPCRTSCSREDEPVAVLVRIVFVSETRGVEGRPAQIYFCSP